MALRAPCWMSLAAVVAALLCSLQGCGHGQPPDPSGTVSALHHNPHWECTADADCRKEEYKLFNGLLQKHTVDFASLVMGGDYEPPQGSSWQVRTSESGKDKAALIWDDSKWELLASRATEFVAARAVMLGHFRSRTMAAELVAGSFHFPHRPSADVIAKVGAQVAALAGNSTNYWVLAMADTNMNAEDTSSLDIVKELGISYSAVETTDPSLLTCCADSGYVFTFDRIFSNRACDLRTVMDSDYVALSKDYSAAPAWAEAVKKAGGKTSAAYHHPVLAQFSPLVPQVTSI